MAKMIPPYVDPSNPNRGENYIFDLFRRETPSDWTVLHSLNIPESEGRSGSEIDFVVMAPGLGLFCLEVKGGSIARKDGLWIISDRQGRQYESTRSPLRQAENGMHNLRQIIKNSSKKKFSKLLMTFGAIFTDTVFDIKDTETDSWRIYDRGDKDLTLKGYISRLSKQSASIYRGHSWFDPVHSYPSQNDINALKNIIKGDFERIKVISSEVEEIEDTISRYTDEQYSCLDGLEDNERCFFKGAAGTGKTMLALESAKRSQSFGNKTLLTCYNRLLAGWLERQLRLQGFDNGLKAIAFLDYLEEIAKDNIPKNAEKDSSYYKDLPFYALEALDGSLFGKFDKLIIDEGQDILCQEHMDLLDCLIQGGLKEGRWNIFCDFERQNIFNENTDCLQIMDYLKARSSFATYSLTTNCRNTREVSQEISRVVGYRSPVLRDEIAGLPVRYRYYEAGGDALGLLVSEIEGLNHNKVLPRDITILSPRVFDKSSVREIGKKYDIINLSKDFDKFFDRDTYTYSTIHKFKGMENSFIIIVDFDDIHKKDDYYKGLLYIGMSRAKAGLIMILNDALKGSLNIN